MIGAEDQTRRPQSLLPTGSGPATVASIPSAAADEGRLPRGTVVGRYVVLAELGAGAMGRVYAAYDPKLDRKVALKVLRFGRDEGQLHRRAERRLLREAQALAKLSHPNVVTVHDVESLHGSLVVAMDFIEGQTLRRWLADGPHPWPEIVAMLGQAAEGLAAAHRAGLVHRDFKPDNVMISHDGRAHVVDFGLARAFEARTDTEDDGSDEQVFVEPSSGVDGTHFTRSLGRAGTPAYMAPEQHLGQGVGPASDQFALCVVLYEALWGRRPFAGDTLLSLTTSVLEGQMEPPPRDSEVPARIRDAIVRGLAVEPTGRHLDIDALLVQLRFDPAARRRRIATVAGGLALVAVAGYGYLGSEERSGPTPCTAGASKATAAWGPDDRRAARDAVLATGLPFAEASWERARAYIDDYAEAWGRDHDEACAATRLRGEQSEHLLDLRMACLARHRQQLVATAALLREADEQVVERLLTVATGLPALQECRDAEALTAAVPPPRDPRVRDEVERVRAGLARAEALGLAGKYAEALTVASAATDAAAPLGYAPAHAEALLRRGYLEDKHGDPATAEQTLSAAAFEAQRARHDAVAARAMAELTFVVGSELGRVADGLGWARHADAAAGRLRDPLAIARQLNNRATVLTTGGRHAEAEIELRRALVLRERGLPLGHPDISSTRTNLAIALEGLGRTDDALAIYEQVLAGREQVLGPDHPGVAAVLTNMSHLLAARGRAAEAEPRILRAISIYEAALGPDHRHLASAYNNLATVRFAEQDYEAAQQAVGKAVEIWQRALPPGHPDLGDGHFNRSSLLYKLGREAEAREQAEAALGVYEQAYGPAHPDVALALLNLGILERDAQPERALARHLRMVEILREVFAADHPELARGLRELSRSLLALERWSEAERAADESRSIVEAREDGQPWEVAVARYLGARARYGSGRDRAAAIDTVRQALADADDEEIEAELEQWLAEVDGAVLPL
ncbi:MAG: tetratricopeptide repeat protein [Nannocystaceae bacterium]